MAPARRRAATQQRSIARCGDLDDDGDDVDDGGGDDDDDVLEYRQDDEAKTVEEEEEEEGWGGEEESWLREVRLRRAIFHQPRPTELLGRGMRLSRMEEGIFSRGGERTREERALSGRRSEQSSSSSAINKYRLLFIYSQF